jgi:hypothetical protein
MDATVVTNGQDNPFLKVCKGYTVQFLPTEELRKVWPSGGSWAIGLDRLFMYPLSYFCWMFGGHTFVETDREYHYDSSETANTRCTRCDMWVPF